MTPNELRTAADDLDHLEELEPRPGRVALADRLRRGAEWLETVEKVRAEAVKARETGKTG